MFDRIKARLNHNQKGSSLAMLALGMSALMFTGGVVVDLGSYYSQISSLQNAADSAALAGSSVYVKKGNTRLIPISNDIDKDGNFTYNIDGQDFTFKLTDTEKEDADKLAEHYVSQNNASTAQGDMETRLWEDRATSTLANGSTVSRVSAYAYRVDLKKPVELYFSRLFGLDGYDVNASAMAVFIIEPDEDNIKEFVEEVSANIYNTIPNYYWQSINDANATITTYNVREGHEKDDFSTIQSKRYYDRIGTKKGYGSENSTYFTSGHQAYISKEFVKVEPLEDKSFIAYAYTSKPISEKWCADPIEGTDKVGLTKMVYNVNRKMIMETLAGKEITGLFLDRMNIGSNATINGKTVYGNYIRALELNISGEEISKDNDTPLYMRFETEPRNDGTLVQPIVINVNGKQKKPVVIAYDGPDILRAQNTVPWVDKKTAKAYRYKSDATKANVTPTATSTVTSAPYTVNLHEDFNGVIYAPFSKVTITGSGKIIGFIMAKEIVDSTNKPASRKLLTVDDVVLPTWGLLDGHNYLVQNVKGSYSVAYDEFYNFTKTAPNM